MDRPIGDHGPAERGPPNRRGQNGRRGRPVVLIGVAGLQWSGITPTGTPTLWEPARRSGMGLLSVRTVGPSTCPQTGG